MQLEKLKDYTSVLREVLKSKAKTALEIFYNEQNCSELLRNEDFFRYTPPYTARVEPTLTFRGYIHKIEPSTLKLGLEAIPFGEKELNVLIKWTLAVHKQETEEYEYLGNSQMNISSQLDVSEITVQSSVIEKRVHDNCLLWRWNIEILPASIGLNKRKLHGALNVSIGQEVKIDKDFDELLKTFPSDVHRENKKTFASILTSIGECQNQQTKHDNRLQDVEQKVLDIYDRISEIFKKSAEKVYFVEGLNKTKLSTNINADKLGQITSIEEDPCTVRKYHFEKDYLLKESTILTELPTNIIHENEIKLEHRKTMREEDLCTIRLDEETVSDVYSINQISLQDATVHETFRSQSPVKNILFIGSDAQMIRVILCSQFRKSQTCLITDTQELQEFQCLEEGIHFYCARISGSNPQREILRLIEKSEDYADLVFHGCIIALSTKYDRCILDIFHASFLKKYCFLILSSELDKSSITQQVKETLPFDWLKFGHEILKNELQIFFGVPFKFDELILKQTLDITLPEQTMHEVLQTVTKKLHTFTRFLNSKKYSHDIDSNIEPLTHQIILLLDQLKKHLH